MRSFIVRCAVVSVCLLAATSLRAEPEMTFKIDNVRATPSAKFQEQMRDARAKVRDWWGATFEGKIEVLVEDKRGPSMALVPAWRGEHGKMLFTSKTVDESRAATHHEMIHVYAPNANRFLAEGLATYGHDLLGGPPAYPNLGKPIDEIAARLAKRETVIGLERTATPAPLDDDAYILGASFVKFLIETHGMEKFRALYALSPLARMKRDPGAPERWQTVYGRGYGDLVDEWLAKLKK